MLTETEVANAKTYWIGIWQAGGFEDQERAAWARWRAATARAARAGSSSSISRLNLAAKPSEAATPQDVILTIVIARKRR